MKFFKLTQILLLLELLLLLPLLVLPLFLRWFHERQQQKQQLQEQQYLYQFHLMFFYHCFNFVSFLFQFGCNFGPRDFGAVSVKFCRGFWVVSWGAAAEVAAEGAATSVPISCWFSHIFVSIVFVLFQLVAKFCPSTRPNVSESVWKGPNGSEQVQTRPQQVRKTSENFEKLREILDKQKSYQKWRKCFLPKASECIRMHRNPSECVKTGPNWTENAEKLCENVEKLRKGLFVMKMYLYA